MPPPLGALRFNTNPQRERGASLSPSLALRVGGVTSSKRGEVASMFAIASCPRKRGTWHPFFLNCPVYISLHYARCWPAALQTGGYGSWFAHAISSRHVVGQQQRAFSNFHRVTKQPVLRAAGGRARIRQLYLCARIMRDAMGVVESKNWASGDFSEWPVGSPTSPAVNCWATFDRPYGTRVWRVTWLRLRGHVAVFPGRHAHGKRGNGTQHATPNMKLL
jgi:hypothetical protein